MKQLTLFFFVIMGLIYSCKNNEVPKVNLVDFKYNADYSHIENDSIKLLKEEVIDAHLVLNNWYESVCNGIRYKHNHGWKTGPFDKNPEETVLNSMKGSISDSIKASTIIKEELKYRMIDLCLKTKDLYNLGGIMAYDNRLNNLTSFSLDFWEPEIPYYEYRNKANDDYSFLVEENSVIPKVDPKDWHNCRLEMISFLGAKTAMVAIPGYLLKSSYAPEAYIFIFEKEDGKWLLSALHQTIKSEEVKNN